MTKTLATGVISVGGKPVLALVHEADNTLLAQVISEDGKLVGDVYPLTWEEFAQGPLKGSTFIWDVKVPAYYLQTQTALGNTVYKVFVADGSAGFQPIMTAAKKEDAVLAVQLLELYSELSQEEGDIIGMAFHRFNYERGMHFNKRPRFWQNFERHGVPFEAPLNDADFLQLVRAECAQRDEKRRADDVRALNFATRPRPESTVHIVEPKAQIVQSKVVQLWQRFIDWLQN